MNRQLQSSMVGFVFGTMSNVYWPSLPSPIYLLMCVAVLIVLIAARRQLTSFFSLKPNVYFLGENFYWLLIGTIIGIVWFASLGHWYSHWQLPNDKFQQVVTIKGRVVDHTHYVAEQKSRYIVAVDQIDEIDFVFARRILLTSTAGEYKFYKGQVIQVESKVKPAHGLLNPGSWSFQRWLVSKKVVATGFISNSDNHKLIKPTNNFRFKLITRIEALKLPSEKWINALIFGDRTGFSSQDWALLQRTGTGHLFSISGLHLGIIFGWLTVLSQLLIFPLVVSFPYRFKRHYLAMYLLVSACFLCGYVYIADGLLPVTRAWLLVAVIVVVKMARRHWQILDHALVMLVMTVLLFPFELLGVSFYLSCYAVLVIWFLLWRYSLTQRSMFAKAALGFKIQTSLIILMTPAVGSFFDAISFSSIFFNVVFVPLVAVIIVPLCLLLLLSVLGLPISSLLLAKWANCAIEILIKWLEYLDVKLEWLYFDANLQLAHWLALSLVLFIFFVPSLKIRQCALVILAMVTALNVLLPPKPGWVFHIFDVGQGTALAISKNHRTLLLDTGNVTLSGKSMAELVVLPALKANGYRTPDTLLISHSDNDHAGGKAYLLEQFPNLKVITTDNACFSGNKLNWEGLTLAFHWPDKTFKGSDNNRSCVVSISDGNFRILFPGDIEKQVEWRLVHRNAAVQADVLVAPHHGSNSSSSRSFVEHVNPSIVLFTQGFFNRWSFPPREVLERYNQLRVTCLATSREGYIQFYINEGQVKMSTSRGGIQRRWYHRLSYDGLPTKLC